MIVWAFSQECLYFMSQCLIMSNMNDINQMRLGVLREIKNIRKFFDMMEKGVKSRDPIKVQRAYFFIMTMVRHMDEGDLTPLSIELFEALTLYNQNNYIDSG